MKKAFYFLSILLVGMFFTVTSCKEKEPDEVCEMDNFCEDKSVTACCVVNVCHYKLDGKEYEDTDAGLAELTKDLGCKAKKSDKDEIRMRLEILMEITKAK